MRAITDGIPYLPGIFGVFIRAERRRQRLSQEDLATILGVTSQTINSWETGRSRSPKLSIIQVKRLCAIFGCELNALPNGDEDVCPRQYDALEDVTKRKAAI